MEFKYYQVDFLPFDLSGRQKESSNFIKCMYANDCITMRDGRLYTSPISSCAFIFNKHYNLDMHLSKSDSIDIHSDVTKAQVTDFLSRPIPFCRYCNVDARRLGTKWGLSKKNMAEWV